MRDIQLILELWGTWSRHKLEMDYASIAAGFKGLLPQNANALSCTDDDALKIDACVGKLKQKRPDEYQTLCDYYIKKISKRQLAKLKKCDEKLIRIKLQLAEGFIDGCLSMLDVKLECENL